MELHIYPDRRAFSITENRNSILFYVDKIRNITFYENSVDTRMNIFSEQIAGGRASYQCVATREQFETLRSLVNSSWDLLTEIQLLAKR